MGIIIVIPTVYIKKTCETSAEEQIGIPEMFHVTVKLREL